MVEKRMLRLRAVTDRTGLSKATLYRLIKKGRFPEPVRLTERAVRWPEEEIDEWLASRPRGVVENPA